MDTVTTSLASHPWLQLEFLNNTVRAYLYSVAFVLIGSLLVILLNRVILNRVQRLAARTGSGLDDFLVLSIKRFGIPSLHAAVLYLGLRDLVMRDAVEKALQLGVYLWIALNVVRFISGLIRATLERHMVSRATSPATAEQEKKSVRGIIVFVNIILWVLAFVLVMDNLGLKVTTFVAGLGIGGIAIALAAQAVLGDLFSYFVIFFDRPFQVGHFIKIGDFMGEVENIGIKTTRLRSLSGETIVMSNKYLTDNQVQNYRLMTRRRMVTIFDVEYGSTTAQLRAVPEVARTLVQRDTRTTFDRCHFKEFAESGLRFELVYYVEVPEYLAAMDIQQEVNIGLKEELEARGLGFAFPTRTLLMAPAPDGGPESSKAPAAGSAKNAGGAA